MAWFSKIFRLSVLASALLARSVLAADAKCEACGMKIPDGVRIHLILKSGAPGAEPRHLCSLSCAKKLRKHDPSLTRAEVVDFNHPDRFLASDQVFLLIGTDKLRGDVGGGVMAPYAAGFGTREEAEAQRRKYGEGQIIQGLENLLKR